MADDTRYVRVFHVHAGRGQRRRIETRIACITDPHYDPYQSAREDGTLAVFEVRGCPSVDSAVGAVAEYLLKDRPDIMTVRQITRYTERPAPGGDPA